MLTINCQRCGAVYKLAPDLYTRKAAGFGVVVTCRRCKNEIHVEAPDVAPANTSPDDDESDDRPTLAPAASAVAAPEHAEEADVKAKSAPPPRATAKATAPWPQAPIVSPPAPAATPRAESPAPPTAGAKPKAESPAPPPAAQRPAPRPMAPSAKPLGTGPFVALSPGLLGVRRPEPLHDSEAPVDSSDFIDEPKRGGSPKAPPVRRPSDTQAKPPPAKSEQKAAPVKRTEPGLPLKFKERPKPPKQKPREPVRSDDVSDDLLSADVGFEGAPPLEPEPRRIQAPTSSALAAPPPEPESEKESPEPAAVASAAKPGPTSPSTSDARPRPSSATKSSRLLPIALVSLGAAGAFGLAFRSQVPDKDERSAADNLPSAENSPPGASAQGAPVVPAAPLPTEGESAASLAVSAARTPTPTNTTPGATARAPRAPSTSSPKETSERSPSPASSTPKLAVTAPAPGTDAPTGPPKTAPEGPFNADAARTALAGAVAQASSCRKPGDPNGVAVVTITFSPSGRVTSANIGGPPFAGTPTGGCIASTLRRARVPAFEGDMVTVKKTVEIR